MRTLRSPAPVPSSPYRGCTPPGTCCPRDKSRPVPDLYVALLAVVAPIVDHTAHRRGALMVNGGGAGRRCVPVHRVGNGGTGRGPCGQSRAGTHGRRGRRLFALPASGRSSRSEDVPSVTGGVRGRWCWEPWPASGQADPSRFRMCQARRMVPAVASKTPRGRGSDASVGVMRGSSEGQAPGGTGHGRQNREGGCSCEASAGRRGGCSVGRLPCGSVGVAPGELCLY